jgi:hypothetical protein
MLAIAAGVSSLLLLLPAIPLRLLVADALYGVGGAAAVRVAELGRDGAVRPALDAQLDGLQRLEMGLDAAMAAEARNGGGRIPLKSGTRRMSAHGDGRDRGEPQNRRLAARTGPCGFDPRTTLSRLFIPGCSFRAASPKRPPIRPHRPVAGHSRCPSRRWLGLAVSRRASPRDPGSPRVAALHPGGSPVTGVRVRTPPTNTLPRRPFRTARPHRAARVPRAPRTVGSAGWRTEWGTRPRIPPPGRRASRPNCRSPRAAGRPSGRSTTT